MLPTPFLQLAASLKEIIARGFVIDAGTQRFIDSTFSHPSAAEVLAILADESNCERDSLVELVFFPDETMQVGLETQLEAADLDPKDEKCLCAILLSEPQDTALVFAAAHETVALEMPQPALECFVARLHLAFRLDGRLRRMIDQRIDPGLGDIIKVKLRNSGIQFTEHQVEFLAQCVSCLDTRQHDYLPCLSLILSVCPQIGPTTDIYRLLSDLKRSCFQGLEKAEEFQHRLSRSNMETLMLQGFRPAFIDPADVRMKMRLIDRICQAVFGRSKYFAKTQTRDLGWAASFPDESLKKAVDLLS
jgi:hypothetical protein